MRKGLLTLALSTVLAASILPSAVVAETSTTSNAEPQLNWIEGTGQKIDMGDNLAELKLGAGYAFLNGTDTQAYEEMSGGVATGNEIGFVVPTDQTQGWAMYFEYEATGHIADDEKDDIDAAELLKSYKKGTEARNEELDPAYHMFVDGWDVEPFYDENLHHLAWSLLAHDAQDNKLINYNVRILTREGVISAILVSDPEHLSADRQTAEKDVLAAFGLKDSSRYEAYDPSTDKKAEFGLTGLILGGAGLVVAKKVGLLAAILLFAKKGWIIIVAAFAAIWRFIRGRSQKKATVEVTQSNDGNSTTN
ncbi:DUF2167 domain-containing protein [Paenibacillus aurantiacus]|uniref:DUF2167 domain-containing protein n=1 Tax=Paenibacillus aurantiacus TaxID=1936118 RepID=A0ABV5KTK9_9BACL